MALVTNSEVREITGVGSDIIDDTTITSLIEEVEKNTYSAYKIYSTPTKVIEILDGNNKNTIRVNYPYVWKVLELTTRNSEIDVSNIKINPVSSMITLDNSDIPYYFIKYQNSVKIKYLSALMEKDTVVTETTADIVAGDNVVVAIEDETGYNVDDWVFVQGMDGYQETSKITATDADEITLNNLIHDYDSGSLITLMKTHETLRQFILYESGMAVGINAIGGSYTFNTSYSLGSLSTTKGVPHPHFSKMIDDLKKQRDIAKNKLMNKLNPIY